MKLNIDGCDFVEGADITPSDWHDILDVFMPSEPMREHLKAIVPVKDIIIDVICESPVPFALKREWMKKLAEKENLDRSFAKAYSDMDDALKELELKKGEIFSITDWWFDDEIRQTKESGGPVFLSLDNVLRYIREDMDYAGDEEDGSDSENECFCWYELNKWRPDEHGNMNRIYKYTLIGDEVVYFSKIIYKEYAGDFLGLPEDYRYSASFNLDTTIPFKAGDIVRIDCSPFRASKLGVIVEAGDHWDCCYPQVLSRNEDGKWVTGAVKHGFVYSDISSPCYSPLFRMERLGPEEEVEELLVRVSRCLKGDEKKGRMFWNELDKTDIIRRLGGTDEELEAVIEKMSTNAETGE